MKLKKNKKNINFIIPLILYPFDVMISIGQDDNELEKVLNKISNLTEDDIYACKYPSIFVKGRAVMFTTNASIIRLKKLPETSEEYGILAHEIFHIVTFIMNRVGMKLKLLVSDEAYAYLIGYLTTEIYKQINNY